MADKKQTNEKEHSFEGCYGEKVMPSELERFIADVFEMNRDAEKAGDDRFATCIWGHSGCVLADTEVEVRKVGNDNAHRIVVSPKPE
jgi:hypothetical protein